MTLRVEGSGAVFAMLDSLEKIRRLDIRMVYPGHGKPFADAKSAIRKAAKRFNQYLSDRSKIGDDLIKKILVYTLMMKPGMEAESFFSYLTGTPWFVQTVDFYFDRQYRAKYDDVMTRLRRRGIITQEQGRLFTTVKP